MIKHLMTYPTIDGCALDMPTSHQILENQQLAGSGSAIGAMLKKITQHFFAKDSEHPYSSGKSHLIGSEGYTSRREVAYLGSSNSTLESL